MHMSISHISKITEVSTRTVKKWLDRGKNWGWRCDKRHWPHLMKRHGESWFRAKFRLLQWCFIAFWLYLRDDIEVLLGEEPP